MNLEVLMSNSDYDRWCKENGVEDWQRDDNRPTQWGAFPCIVFMHRQGPCDDPCIEFATMSDVEHALSKMKGRKQ